MVIFMANADIIVTQKNPSDDSMVSTTAKIIVATNTRDCMINVTDNRKYREPYLQFRGECVLFQWFVCRVISYSRSVGKHIDYLKQNVWHFWGYPRIWEKVCPIVIQYWRRSVADIQFKVNEILKIKICLYFSKSIFPLICWKSGIFQNYLGAITLSALISIFQGKSVPIPWRSNIMKTT